ncbi:MAG: QueT transporter family protein [Ruminococcaceae bacterium]|nr:QueT transporter family protein [Oscillospiraceae bacterium]
MKSKQKIRSIAVGAVIAALYVVLTYLANMLGLASGAIQVRLSEILTVMPVFTFSAVPGLFIGCLIANILTGCALWDIVFGSLATLIGALGTYFLRKHKLLAVLPPILANAIIVPFVLLFVYSLEGTYFYFFATVGIGEVISCGVFGTILLKSLEKSRFKL